MEEKKVVFSIPEYRYDEFIGKMRKLSKRAVKLGLDEMQYTKIGEHTETFRRHPITDVALAFPMIIKFYDVTVSGFEPKFAGWQFLAKIEYESAGAIISVIPGESIDTRFRTTGSICEHCRIDRYRKVTFVVRHEDKTELQVGSTCIHDFLGHGSPEKIASYCESLFSFIRKMKEDDYYTEGYEARFDVVETLAITSACIRKYGWVSTTKAKENGMQPTVEDVIRYYSDSPSGIETRKEVHVNDGDTLIANAAREWALSQIPSSDYMHNIITLCKCDNITRNPLATLVSLIQVYKNAKEKELKKEDASPSEYIGTVGGKRITIENVKVIGISVFDSGYGVCYCYRFIHQDRDILTWFSSRCMFLKENDIVNKLSFSVKKHDLYKGQKITIITRAKCNH